MKIQSAKAGIGTGRAGLQAASGLFSNAGLFDKGVKSFNPLDLDPYLLFDAESSMIGTLENPTLDLDPSKQDTLDVITATRAGTATYTDVNGNIATAPANTVRVDQTQGAELTPNIYQLVGNTNFGGWVIQSNTTLTSNTTETLSPDGTNNATKMTSNGSEGLYIPSLGTASLNTKSIFSKGVSGGEQVILQDPHQNIDPLTCTLTTEWQRFHLTQTQTGSFGLWLTNIPSGGIYAYGPQVQVQGLTDFVANTTGSPKFITGATFGPRVPMILVEPSATNLVTYSEDFSNSYWTKSGTSSVTPNTTISPDGTLNADTISNATGTSTSDTVYRTINPDDVDHTFSAYVKSAGATTMSLITRNGINGVILSQAISLTDEWQRVTLTHNIQNGQLIFGGSDGDFHLWGAQVETGSVATSYIPTSGGNAAARTRAADDLVISGSAFSSFYNQSEGTVYTEFEPRDVSISNKTTLDFSNGTGTERILSLAYSSYHVYVVDGGVEQAHLDGGTYTAGAVNRLAFSYKANNIQVSVGGGAVVSDTSASIPTLDRLQIGASYANSSQLNGHIKRLIYWPYHSDSL